LFVAATRWDEAGKIDYALHGEMAVLCLARDPRGYGILTRPRDHIGKDALIVGRDLNFPSIQKTYGRYFESMEELAPITITRGGRPALELSVYLAHKLRDAPNRTRTDLLGPLALDPR